MSVERMTPRCLLMSTISMSIIFLISRQRKLLTCLCGKVAKRKNNGHGGRETASPEPGPSRCSQHACPETVHSLRNNVFRDSLVDESIIHVQFCLGFLNSRCQVVDEYCKEYWSRVGPLRDAGGNRVGFCTAILRCRYGPHEKS